MNDLNTKDMVAMTDVKVSCNISEALIYAIFYMKYINQYYTSFVSGSNPPPECMGQQPSSVAEEMEFLRTFMSLDEKERQLIGHNFTSFIKGCTFRGRDCLNET